MKRNNGTWTPLFRYVSNKYPRHIVDQALDSRFHDITKELVFEDFAAADKIAYYREMIKNLIDLNMSDIFIISMCHAVQKLAIERIHIIGDVYDRGSNPNLIIKHLSESWQNFDFELGNHDILWMGSMAGSKLCMLNLIRISARYHNLALLKNAYDIDLTSMIKFATNRYVPSPNFEPKVTSANVTNQERNIENCVQ